MLADLDALQADARALQGELTMHRLRAGLGGDRLVTRAVGFASRAGTPPVGFELTIATAGLAGGVEFAATALELAASAQCLVLAPPSEAMRKLAKVLRTAGHQVELAGFAGATPDGLPGETIRRLGRDCLFVP